MPCRDWDDSRVVYQEVDNPKLSAALCGILGVMEADPALKGKDYMFLLDRIDWREQGITKAWLLKWWENHKEEDKARRKREAEKKAQKALKEKTLAKLTPQERKALGL